MLSFSDPELTSLARAAARRGGGERYEGMGIAFHERLRAGFLEIAKAEPERCLVVDAASPAEAVTERLRAALTERLQAA